MFILFCSTIIGKKHNIEMEQENNSSKNQRNNYKKKGKNSKNWKAPQPKIVNGNRYKDGGRVTREDGEEYYDRKQHNYEMKDLKFLNGPLLLDESGKNKFRLPNEHLTFIDQAKKLLDGDAKESPEYQYQFAYTIFNQIIGMNKNERLLFLNLKTSTDILRAFILWSDSQLFYAFLESLKGCWEYISCGKFSNNFVSDILTQLTVDKEDGNPELMEKCDSHLKEIGKEFKLSFIEDAYGWKLYYKFLKLVQDENNYIELLKQIEKHTNNNNWFQSESSINWSKFLEKLFSYILKNKDSLPEPILNQLHNIWESIIGIPLSSILQRKKELDQGNFKITADQKKFLIDNSQNRTLSELLQIFIEKFATKEFIVQIYEKIFKNELSSIIDDDNGLYVTVSLIKSLTKKESIIEAIKSLLDRKITVYWNGNMRNLVNVIAEASAKYDFEQQNIFESLESLVKHRIQQSSNSQSSDTTPQYERKNLVEKLILKPFKKHHIRERFDRFGALLICNLFDFKISISKSLLFDFNDFSKDDLFDLCSDRWGSLITEKWIEVLFSNIDISKKECEDLRNNLMLKFTGNIVKFSCHIFGSRIVEKLINCLDGERLKIVLDEFLSGEIACRDNKFAKILYAKYSLQGYKLNSQSWITQHDKSKKVASMFSSLLDTPSDEKKKEKNESKPSTSSNVDQKNASSSKAQQEKDSMADTNEEKRKSKLAKFDKLVNSNNQAASKLSSNDFSLGKRSRKNDEPNLPSKKKRTH